MDVLPPKQAKPDDQEYRIFVFVPATVRLALVEESTSRGIDWSRLGGAVLTMWVKAGCPDRILSEVPPVSVGSANE